MNLHNAFYKTQCALTSCGVTQGACSSLECNFLQLAAGVGLKRAVFPRVSYGRNALPKAGCLSTSSAADKKILPGFLLVSYSR